MLRSLIKSPRTLFLRNRDQGLGLVNLSLGDNSSIHYSHITVSEEERDEEVKRLKDEGTTAMG